MIKPVTQYIITCDTPGCGKQSAIHHSTEALIGQVENLGWKKRSVRYGPQNAREVVIQFRCPKCVRNGEYPEGWTPEVAGGTQG